MNPAHPFVTALVPKSIGLEFAVPRGISILAEAVKTSSSCFLLSDALEAVAVSDCEEKTLRETGSRVNFL